jgi:hypothetical protein
MNENHEVFPPGGWTCNELVLRTGGSCLSHGFDRAVKLDQEADGYEQEDWPVLAEDVVEIITITQVEPRGALLIKRLIINRFPRPVGSHV